MNLALTFFGLYITIGVFVCAHAVDANDRPLPAHHLVFVVLVWPVLFLLGENNNGDGP